MSILLSLWWPLWPFSSEYFIRNWDDLGGGHFIALATAINIALVSWQAFRDRVRSADRRLEEKVNSIAASVADLLDTAHFRRLIDKVLRPLFRIRLWGWRFVYGLALLAAPIGIALLYCHAESPYDLLLLLPTSLQLFVSWTTLAIMTIWMWLMRKGMMFFGPTIPSRQGASKEVTDLLRQAKGVSDRDQAARR
jgi:hypothetical protein